MKNNTNYILATIIFLLAFSQVQSQAPDWVWVRFAPSTIFNYGEETSMTTDRTDNVYITGWYDGTITFGSYVITSNQGAFLAKYDSYGNVLWAKTNLGGHAFGESVTTDNYGNVYIIGSYLSSIALDLHILSSAGGEDVFVAKFNSSGNVMWAKSCGGINDEQGRSISSDSQGNIYITGWFSSASFYIGTDTLTNTLSNEIFIAKFDSSGNEIWARSTSGGTVSANSFGIASDGIGNTYLTGDFFSPSILFGSNILNNAGQGDIFLSKYDSSGNVLWAKRAGGINREDANHVNIDSYNNIYLTGRYNSPSITFDSDTLINTGSYDGFFVKYDSSGNVLWAKNIGGSLDENGWGIAADGNNKIYLTGGFTSTSVVLDSIILAQPSGSIDPMFIAGYDSSGKILFAKGIGSGGDDNSSIAISTSSCIYIGGDFQNTILVLGNDTLFVGPGQENVFVSKLCYKQIGENIPEIAKDKEFILYPNPFEDKLNILVNENDEIEIILYDILSRKLLQQKFTNSISLNTSQLKDGIYIYELKNKNGIVKKGKIVKQ